MKNYEIKEIDGKMYKVFPNGSRLKHVENKFPHLPKHAGVYLLIDVESGLMYVGSSSNVNKRASSYTSISRHELLDRGLFKEINGNNLVFKLLEDCKYLSLHDRITLEKDWILKMNTLKPNGLNTVLPLKVKNKVKPNCAKIKFNKTIRTTI